MSSFPLTIAQTLCDVVLYCHANHTFQSQWPCNCTPWQNQFAYQVTTGGLRNASAKHGHLHTCLVTQLTFVCTAITTLHRCTDLLCASCTSILNQDMLSNRLPLAGELGCGHSASGINGLVFQSCQQVAGKCHCQDQGGHCTSCCHHMALQHVPYTCVKQSAAHS